jgi:hypothetical protein
VYNNVFESLTTYNIRFKAEFNYLEHNLCKMVPDSKEKVLRADLLVEIYLKNQDKSLTIIVEVQG